MTPVSRETLGSCAPSSRLLSGGLNHRIFFKKSLSEQQVGKSQNRNSQFDRKLHTKNPGVILPSLLWEYPGNTFPLAHGAARLSLAVLLQSRALSTWDLFPFPKGWQTAAPHPTPQPEPWAEQSCRQTQSHRTPQHSYFLFFKKKFFWSCNKRLNCKRRKICQAGHAEALSWHPQGLCSWVMDVPQPGLLHTPCPGSLLFSKPSEGEQEEPLQRLAACAAQALPHHHDKGRFEHPSANSMVPF